MPNPQLGSGGWLALFRRHEFSLLIAIAAVVVVTALVDSRHNYTQRPSDSAVDIVRQTSLLGIFSLGAAIVIISGGIDLSSGSVIAFSGTICATIMLMLAPEAMSNGDPVGLSVIIIAILVTLFSGFLIGSLHAWLITAIGLPPFVATLATLVGLRSLARAICQNATLTLTGHSRTQIDISDATFRELGTNVWIPATIFLFCIALGWLVLSRTVLGRHLYALGGNEEAARLSGIRTDRLKWFAYTTAAILSSIAGILKAAEISVASPQTAGRAYELNAIAAAVVGGCSLQGGIGTMTGTALGALFLRTVIDGVAKIIKTGADVYEGLIVGVVVVFAVAFSQFGGKSGRQRYFSGWIGAVAVVNLSLLTGALVLLVGPKVMEGRMAINAPGTAGLFAIVTLVLLMVVRRRETKAK